MNYYYPMMDNNNISWNVTIILLLITMLIIVASVALRLTKNSDADQRHKDDPIDIAKERYAKGEISKEQFESIKKDLREH